MEDMLMDRQYRDGFSLRRLFQHLANDGSSAQVRYQDCHSKQRNKKESRPDRPLPRKWAQPFRTGERGAQEVFYCESEEKGGGSGNRGMAGSPQIARQNRRIARHPFKSDAKDARFEFRAVPNR